MSFLENLPETQIFGENSDNSEPISITEIQYVANTTRKCGIKNGIITPKIIDDFPLSSYVSVKTNVTENQSPKKINQEQIRIVSGDSVEIIVPCKPMLNSTASKTLTNEYSLTKEYREDKENMDMFNSEKKYEQSIKVKIIPAEKKENINSNIPEQSLKNPIKYSKTYNSKSQLNSIEEEDFDDFEELIKYQEAHLPVPLSKKDDEHFKILTMKKMKRKSMPPNKSVRKFAEDLEPQYEKNFRIHNAFSSLKKKKPVHSTQKFYASNYFLENKNKKLEKFMVFRDKDIGIYEYWQAHIHEAINDEDIETDDEQKKIAKNFCKKEVREAFEYIVNNKNDAFVNFNRYGNLRGSNKENEKEMKMIRYNLKKFLYNKNNNYGGH